MMWHLPQSLGLFGRLILLTIIFVALSQVCGLVVRGGLWVVEWIVTAIYATTMPPLRWRLFAQWEPKETFPFSPNERHIMFGVTGVLTVVWVWFLLHLIWAMAIILRILPV